MGFIEVEDMSGVNHTARLKAIPPGLYREIILEDHQVGLNIHT